MITNELVLALYIGALILLHNKRDALIALFCFALAYAVASGQFSHSYQYHLSMSLIYIIGALSSSTPRLRVLFFAILVYQYGMSFDAFVWPTTETLLYQSYQYVAFLLNLIVIGCIGGGYGFSDCRDFVYRRRRFNDSRLALSVADKAGVRKGETS